MYDDAVAVSSDRCDDASELQHGSESDSIMYTPDYSQEHLVRQHPDSSRSDQDRSSTVKRSRSSSRYAVLFFSAVSSVLLLCELDSKKGIQPAESPV